MMKIENIIDTDGKGIYTINIGENTEYLNPHDYYKTSYIQMVISDLKIILNLKNPFLASMVSDEILMKRATSYYQDILIDIMSANIPQELIILLETKEKKNQLKLLKNICISPDILAKFNLEAYTKFGFLYSQYNFETLPINIKREKMPKLIHLDNNKINKIGNTIYKDGELKNIIIQRKVIVANFLDLKDTWHCFFTTYDSLGGLETWKNGTPHYHYISSSFNISRESVIQRMKEGNYPQTGIHIPFDNEKIK